MPIVHRHTRRTRFPYRKGEEVYIKNSGKGRFIRYTKNGQIIIEHLGYNFTYPQKKIEPMYSAGRG